MRIIGIDPGTRIAGYGIVELVNNSIVPIAVGTWHLNHTFTLPVKLAQLAIEFRRIVSIHKPTHLFIETAFVAENVKSALLLGSARGVFLSEAHLAGLIIGEISPTSAKKCITGNGRAPKELVATVMSQLLKISIADLPFDATDALAIAYAGTLKYSNKNIIDCGEIPTATEEKNKILNSWMKDKQKRSSRNTF